jgi:hypothetical protein
MAALMSVGGLSCEKSPGTNSTGSSTAPTTPVASPAIQRTQHTASGDAFLDVATTIDRTDLTVADRIHLTLVCSTRSAATLTLPEFGSQLGDFTVVSSSKNERSPDAARHEITLRLVLEPFLAGDKTIPPIAIQAADFGHTLKLSTDAVPIHVAAIADAKADAQTPLGAPKAPVDLIVPKKSSRVTLWTALGGGLLAALVALGFAAFTTARRAKRESDPTFQLRRRLDAVGRTLAEATTSAAAAATCEDLFRAFAPYLAITLGVPADTQPHARIASTITASDRLTFPQRDELNALLADLERARFAPDGVSIPIVRALLDRVTAFVDRTSMSEVRP